MTAAASASLFATSKNSWGQPDGSTLCEVALGGHRRPKTPPWCEEVLMQVLDPREELRQGVCWGTLASEWPHLLARISELGKHQEGLEIFTVGTFLRTDLSEA
jgi:hypothetical protein